MLLACFVLTLCYIAYMDITKRKVFNISILFILVFGFFIVCIEGYGFSNNVFYSLISFLILLLFFLFFYRIGYMGAGDVKLGAVLAFCFGLHNFLFIWIVSLFFSVFYSVVDLILKRFGLDYLRLKISGGVNLELKKNVPYGAFLSVGSIIYILGFI